MEKTKGMQASERLLEIKHLLNTGGMTYEEAKACAAGPLETLNEEMARISKEYGMRPRRVSFIGFMR